MAHHVAGRYEFTLSKQDLEKAVTELNEPRDNEERLVKIDNLRNDFILQNKSLTLKRSDDVFMLRFLRAAKFHHHQALTLLRNYHLLYQTWPEVYDKVENPSTVKHIFDNGGFVALRQKAEDGSAVCIGRMGKTKDISFTEFVAAFLLTFNRLLDEESVQIHGITVIEDMSYANLNLIKQLVKLARRALHLVVNVIPMRMRSLNFVREPPLLDLLFPFVRLFLKRKINQRIHFHGKLLSTLPNVIDPSILPPDYGGTGQSLDDRAAKWWRDVIYGEEYSSFRSAKDEVAI